MSTQPTPHWRTTFTLDRSLALDRAIVALLYGHALRRGSVCGLDLADMDFPGGSLAVAWNGRREKKWITLDPAIAHHLGRWVLLRGPEPGPLFRRLDRAAAGGAALVAGTLQRIKVHLQMLLGCGWVGHVRDLHPFNGCRGAAGGPHAAPSAPAGRPGCLGSAAPSSEPWPRHRAERVPRLGAAWRRGAPRRE